MKVLQRLFVILSIIALTFAVVGCEEKQDAQTEEPAAEAPAEEAAEEAAEKAPAAAEAEEEPAAEEEGEGDEPEAPPASQ